MKPLPQVNETLLVRTDFSDEAAWQEICAGMCAIDPAMREVLDLYASLDESMAQALATKGVPLPHVVDDREYQAATTEALEELAAGVSQSPLMFIVDETAVSRPDHPILVVDLFQVAGRPFAQFPRRCLQSTATSPSPTATGKTSPGSWTTMACFAA